MNFLSVLAPIVLEKCKIFSTSNTIHFYLIVIVELVILTLIVWLNSYRPTVNNFYTVTSSVLKYNFLDFIQMGWKEFKAEIDRQILQHQRKRNISISKVHYGNRKDIPDFINRMIISFNSTESSEEYSLIIMQNFVRKFLSENDARFTLRRYNESTKKMEAIITTNQEQCPSPIPVNRKSLITKSMQMEAPVIYSRNAEFHYNTKKSIANKIYDDYVSYCLISDERKKIPILSICLDVKGDNTVDKMHYLVDTNIFAIICNTILYKIQLEMEEDE